MAASSEVEVASLAAEDFLFLVFPPVELLLVLLGPLVLAASSSSSPGGGNERFLFFLGGMALVVCSLPIDKVKGIPREDKG